MSVKNKALISGAIAAVIAIALIGGVMFTPGLLNKSSSTGSTITSSSTSFGGITSTSSQSGQTGSGTLAVMMTDPPTVPDGVTAVYINYSNIEVHFSQAGNQSGWTDMQTSGEINLMSVINSSQTIAATNIQSGKFNALRFNVTSAVVTFLGKNYSADLVYQHHTLSVLIPGGITVSNGQTAGAVIDMTPTVILLGTPSNPTFAFIPVATCYTLPANSVQNHPRIGDRDDFKGMIAQRIQGMSKFEITSTNLDQNSFNVTLENTGNATMIFRMVVLTSTTTTSGGWVPSLSLEAISKISEIFIVAPNGTLVPMTANTKDGAIQTLALSGFALAPGSSATFSYNGPITMGALALLQGLTPTHTVSVGDKYIVTVFGNGLHAQTSVNAGISASDTTSSTSSISTSSEETSSDSTQTTTSNGSTSFDSSSTTVSVTSSETTTSTS